MKFGPPVMIQILVTEELRARQLVAEGKAAEEEKVLAELKAYDEEHSKKGKSKDKDKTETPWWEKDQANEEKGLLGWEQLATAHTRDRVANKHGLGPYAQKKRKVDHESAATDARKAERVHAPESNNASGSTAGRPWIASAFPLSTDKHEVIKKEDLLPVLLKTARPYGGGMFSCAVGVASQKAKINPGTVPSAAPR
jgi:hypothetical protein